MTHEWMSPYEIRTTILQQINKLSNLKTVSNEQILARVRESTQGALGDCEDGIREIRINNEILSQDSCN